MEDSIIRRCQFVIPKKDRPCRMLVKEGKKYCGEHAFADPLNAERIPCPLDKNHTINVKELDDHLAKCNSRLRTDLKWVVENINGVLPDVVKEPCTKKVTLKQLSDAQVDSFVEKLNRTNEEICKFFVQDYKNHAIFESSLNSTEFSMVQKKHFIQQASIIGHLEENSLLGDDSCFVEFGAGRAKLAYWLSKCLTEKGFTKCRCLLLEKSGQRYKFDNKLIREGTNLVDFHRLRCSIEHVDLRRVPWLVDQCQPLVAVCKHLCGSGTDAALRSLVNCRKVSDDGVKGLEVIGAALAPCCHHRCTWDEFIGKEFFTEFGYTDEEFHLVTQMSSWATCGIALQAKNESESNNLQTRKESQTNTFRNINRENVGRQCKALLDYCRAKFLEREGFNVQLKYFVAVEVTPENVLLLITARS